MSRFYVVGGREKSDARKKEEWHHFRKAVIVSVDAERDEAEVALEYESPESVRPDDDPSIIFKAGTVQDGRLYACTQTEVLIFDFPSLEQVGYCSAECFNDVHHVKPAGEGNLLVVNTGLDMLVEMSPEGEMLREWNVLGEDPWAEYSRDVDYRKISTTKPHDSHPNYVFTHDSDVWVTRFEQRDAIAVTSPDRRIDIDLEKPHDGVVDGDRVYFTTVDGRIVIADLRSARVERVVDLNRITDTEVALGWCRGLSLLGDGKVAVGFSRLRPTSVQKNVWWVKRKVLNAESSEKLPTRIAIYDLEEERFCWEYDLEPCGLNAIFSIHPL